MPKGFLSESWEAWDGKKGKSIASLKNSEASRSSLIALFGGVSNLPSSVMRAEIIHVDKRVDKEGAKRTLKATAPTRHLSEDQSLPKMVRTAFKISGTGVCAGALSIFPQKIGRSVVILYSEPGQVVFDPFAGHNSRLDLCVRAGRHYIGCDLSTEFMRFNFERAERLREMCPKARIELHHCDSRKVPVKSEVADFTITSPPYYQQEYYGDEPEQLGKCKTYKEFLVGLGQVLKENFRVLKPGAYAAWFINDFRRNKKMHFYHMDTLRLGRKAGFIAHDIMVVDLGRSLRDLFTNQVMQSKILPKRHEYCVIFRKPKADPR